jgi:hypothetical protein
VPEGTVEMARGSRTVVVNTRTLLIVTAIVETATGIGLLVVPSVIVGLLLGAGLSSPQSLVMGRVTGGALISIGVMCWLARNEHGGAQAGLVAGILIYNGAVAILLIYAATVAMIHGIALWPVSLLHLALALWCVFCLLPR